MKTFFIFIFCALLSTNCIAQKCLELDSAFLNNFSVLDSVSSGLKPQRNLTLSQNSFIRIMNYWTGEVASFDDENGYKLLTRDITFWRHWYLKNCSSVDPEEFRRTFDIYVRMLSKGKCEESEWEYITKVGKKYQRLNDQH